MRTIQEIRNELEEMRRDDTVERLLARARAHRVEAMRLLGLPPVEFDRDDLKPSRSPEKPARR